MRSTVVVVGAGQAGAQAVETLRREGHIGRIVLVGEEAHLPYQRPPLSKKYLAGELAVDRLLLEPQTFYDQHRVELSLGSRAVRLDPRCRALVLSEGRELIYDQLLLCLGSRPRELTCTGANVDCVRYLRGIDDVSCIQPRLAPGTRVTVIGGGFIGLEVAATAARLGCRVTVLEMTDRVMNRVVAPAISEFLEREHRSHGVNIVCNTRLVCLEGDSRVVRVRCADGTTHVSDLLVAGIGAVPNVELAKEAGLCCDNGIVVDEYCRTSESHVYAAGDCTSHRSIRYGARVRLESVDNAVEQAKTAALNMLGKSTVHDRVPWFWSDQFDHKLLTVGLSNGHEQQVVRGDPASGSFSVCYLKDDRLHALEAVNHAKDYMAARKLILDRVRLRVERLADPTVALKDVGVI